MNSSLEIATMKEFNDRYEQSGGWIALAPITFSTDTSRFITKTVRTKDSTFQVTLDRYDPHSTTKLVQFLKKDNLPVNVHKLDSLFRIELTNRRYPNLDTYVEYLGLTAMQILDRSSTPDSSPYLSSELFTLDIANSIGVKGYVKNPIYSILRTMIFQLILSAILIGISTLFIFILSRTIFWQKKEEAMRQDSVNAMTHEFKRPISSAVAQASLIPFYMEKSQNEKVLKYADNILLELNKLTVYTERIQQLSKNNKENIVLNRVNINMKVFFESIVERYSNSEEKSVKIELKISTQQQTICVDLLHFSNIIDNLIENALKYSKDEVQISIDISEDRDDVIITVRDNGVGISNFDLPYIFDKYYRANNKSIQEKVGFGLGLTYVKALVHAHNGKINVNSKLNIGSIFTINLSKSNNEK